MEDLHQSSVAAQIAPTQPLPELQDSGNSSLDMDERPDNHDKGPEILLGFGLLLATSIVFCLGVLLVWFAILRENQTFWTNAGGYPLWLRDLVLWTYLPLLVATILVLFGLSMACSSKVCGSLRFFVLNALLLAVCWGLLATSGFIALENNLINLLEGNQLHHHKDPGQFP